MDHISDDAGPCHVHNRMRLRKPHLKDNLPNQLCLLCNRAFCVDHKGKQERVCEINHESYYLNHPGDQKYLYRRYEDWKKDNDQKMVDETSMGRWWLGEKKTVRKVEVGAGKDEGSRLDKGQD
ncbi:uncharacterized protein B0J16DRAFT_86859 [Fusarium flagelliforme]|uniref:uncharacterized protein n=1 Tax=Fusarium flagelliforme TaxID=2675880 RepID=UPI001E8E79EF|nr:uncharacterized protein B0J16DRAFT_86859 [Fusarium flagelliforme]KAH7193880.1 hypothetical protein B0J16DRAFT_86859 [Fusarium flagelliforme]